MRNTIYFKWFMDSLSESDKNEFNQMSIINQKNWYIQYLENHYEPKTK